MIKNGWKAAEMREVLKKMLESRISAGATEKFPGWEKNLTQRRLRGPTTWKDALKNALRDIANWRIKKQSSHTKSQVLAWMITISKKRNLNQLENCQKKKKVTTNCLEMLVRGTKLAEQTSHGQRLATDVWQD